jgi:hypothetical protein
MSLIVLDSHGLTIDREYLYKLQRDSSLLECLDARGVHEWEGYEEALIAHKGGWVEIDGEEYGP